MSGVAMKIDHRHLSLAMAFCSLWVTAAMAAVPGGITIIELPADVESAWFADRPVMLLKDETPPLAVLGVPLDTPVGAHEITVAVSGQGSQRVSFEVEDKAYPEQHVTIKNRRMVNPDPVDLDRIGKESRLMRKHYLTFADLAETPFPLSWPLEGPVSSEFGLRRFFNGEPRNPHSGLDIAAPEGTPVLAPAAGVISLTGDFFFNGNTVFIDHGAGLVTMACHLSAIDVEQGQGVTRGEQVGRVGATGRATGAHLHWSLSLNGTRVDPRAGLQLFEAPPVPPAPEPIGASDAPPSSPAGD
jgi:murein DD-endopeptidase MepM/ murein hydrolase activator NlpD